MTLRILMILAAIFGILLLLRRGLSRRQTTSAPLLKPHPALKAAEEMVRCAHCGLHVPYSASLHDRHHGYCSASHRQAGPRPGEPA